jgi:hypothetical protein
MDTLSRGPLAARHAAIAAARQLLERADGFKARARAELVRAEAVLSRIRPLLAPPRDDTPMESMYDQD